MMTEPLVFIHIPKTAGQSLRSELRYNTLPSERYAKSVYLENEKTDICTQAAERPDELADVQLVYGHQFHGIDQIWPGPVRYITMLRDPVDRMMSYYYYSQKPKRNRTRQGRLAREAGSVVEFARGSPFVCNAQSILLAGKPGWAHTKDSVHIRRPATTNTVQLAKYHLAHCVWFGLQGRYEPSVRSLRTFMGWPQREAQPRRNPTHHRPPVDKLTPEDTEELMAHCWADVELYKFAELFWLERYGREE